MMHGGVFATLVALAVAAGSEASAAQAARAPESARVPDEQIRVEQVSGGTILIRDVTGSYAQHPRLFAEMMAVRDRLFTSVGACFGIYPLDPDAVERPADLRWQIGVRVSAAQGRQSLARPPKPYRLVALGPTEAAVLETDVQHAGTDGLAMYRWMAEHGYVQTAPTRLEYLSHDGSPMLLPARIIVPVRKRPSGLVLPARR